jgi:transcriptional regulator with XRE-family HTH domain
MNLAHKVKKRREELGLSQEELAKRMGYSSRTSINKIENGRPCSQKIIARLANALDVSVPYLMGWDEVDREEVQKKAGTVADAALRMKTDPDFLSIIKMLLVLDREKLKDVLNLLVVFLK